MSLSKGIRDSFKAKGLEFVSIVESKNPDKSVLTYKDGSGKTLTKEVPIRIDNLEEALAEIEVIDPDGLASFLLG